MDKDYRNAADLTSGGAKLTAEEVKMYRTRYKANEVTVRGIAKMHSMSAEAVRRMLRGETWAWVNDRPSEEMLAAGAAASQERFRKMMEAQGLAIESGAVAQEELGVAVPDAVKQQVEMLTGRKFGGGSE